MKVEIKGKKLIITLDLITPPRPSSSGKTLLVATTGGNKASDATVKGKQVTVGCNAYVYKD